MYKPKIIRQES